MCGALREAGRAAKRLVGWQAQRRGGAPQAHHASRAGQPRQIACATGIRKCRVQGTSTLTSIVQSGCAIANCSSAAALPRDS